MSKTIEGIPEYFTHEQYLGIFTACGIDPKHVVEMRLAAEGVHVLVFAVGEDGKRIIDLQNSQGDRGLYHKHRIFIPVRHDPDDVRVSRVTEVGAA